MSLNDILGTLPSGAVSTLDDDSVSRILRESYIFNQCEVARRKKMRERIDLYKDRSGKQTLAMLDDIFKNNKVRDWRKKFADLASFQNLTRRIVRETSTVYSEPASRKIASKGLNERYQQLQRQVRMDRRMRVANKMLNLCNEVVVWFDVSVGSPKIRIVTPDNFWAVCHPNDATELVAIIFDQSPPPTRIVTSNTPHYLVVTDTDSFHLNSSGRMVGAKTPLGLSRMPMLLVHKEEPTEALLDPDPGSDITQAHKALLLINVMFLKHQKSGTKQAVASGDIGEMVRGQAMDEEEVLQVPEGVLMSTLDLGADPDSYIQAGRNVLKQIASNNGIPESVFDLSYQATSGFEIELKRTSLTEIRNDQIIDWRPVEQELAEIMVEVLTEARDPLAFNTNGWSIDFGEVSQPKDPIQMLAYWKDLKSQGLINQIQMYQALNPEATEDEAIEQILTNIDINALFVEKLRALNMSPIAPMDGSDNDEESDDEESDDEEESEEMEAAQ